MNLLYLTILCPLVGFLLLVFSNGRWPENLTAIVGVGSIGLAALTSLWVTVTFLSAQSDDAMVYTQKLWHWMAIENFQISITLSLDALSLVMLSVVTGVGFIIHLYASWYMRGEKSYSRFFAYTNLFIANMLVLILADNLLLMYLGWEGVGLCSYLLIGFYYANPKNGAAAMKAFIITRIGDVLLALSLFILYKQFETLNFHELMILAPKKLTKGSPEITWAMLMLLGGAVGKSAQFPLQTWLADAMVGPTPVSALIHAATMVTAGVYLIERVNSLFLMAPDVLYLVGIIGAVTLLLASFAALVQTDIKRVLAYSTMSQVGYMFLALGVQAWDAAIFHLITHAFFKALLFLASGSVILSCHHEQDIFKMGGLYKLIPLVYVCFLVGGAALSSFPLVTASFYSKGAILLGTVSNGNDMLTTAVLLGVFVTSIYTFRMILIVFHGKMKIIIDKTYRGISHHLPLLVLLVLSTFIGTWIMSPIFQGVYLSNKLNYNNKFMLEITSSVISIIGICLSLNLWAYQRHLVNAIATSTLGRLLTVLWFNAWGFDWLYDKIFVKSYLAIGSLLEHDPINKVMNLPALLARWAGHNLTLSENGQLRWYAASIGLGAVFVVSLLVFFRY